MSSLAVREPGPFRERNFVLLLVLFCGIGLALVSLAQVVTSSEAREIDVARTMVREGTWLYPLRHGVVPSKPPLFHWCAAVLGLIRGDVTVAMARLVSLYAALGIIVIIGATVARFLRAGVVRSAALDRELAITLSAGVLVTTHGFLSQAMLGMVDMVFALCVTGAICSVLGRMAAVLGREGAMTVESLTSQDMGRWFETFFVWASFAVLAKGPLGIILPGVIVTVVVSCAVGPIGALRAIMRPRLGWLWFLMVTVPWYLGGALLSGDAFVWRQIVFENLQRLMGGEEINAEAPWFYLPSLARTAFPWSFVAVLSGIMLARHSWSPPGLTREQRFRTALLWSGALWSIAGVLFFSLASGKRHAYMLPLYPGLALWCSISTAALWPVLSLPVQQKVMGFVRILSKVLVVGMLGILITGSFVLESPQEWGISLTPLHEVALGYLTGRLWVIAMIVALTVVIAGMMRRGQGVGRPLGSLLCVCSALLMLALALGNGVKGAFKDFYGISQRFQELVPVTEKVAIVRAPRDEAFDVVALHLDRASWFFELTPDSLRQLFSKGCPARFLLMKEEIVAGVVSKSEERSISLSLRAEEAPLIDLLRGREERKLFLFECAGSMSANPDAVI